MSREEAKQLLISLGITEPTDESITTMLNSIGKNAKAKDDLVERQKSKIAEIEAQMEEYKKTLEDKENANLTDLEKLQNQIKKLEEQSALDKQTIRDMNTRNGLAEKGIVGEQADKLIKSLNNGTFDFDVLGQIIADRQAEAVSAREKELLKDIPNPDNNGNGNGDKNIEDAFLKSIGESIKGDASTSSDIVSAYI